MEICRDPDLILASCLRVNENILAPTKLCQKMKLNCCVEREFFIFFRAGKMPYSIYDLFFVFESLFSISVSVYIAIITFSPFLWFSGLVKIRGVTAQRRAMLDVVIVFFCIYMGYF